LFGAGGRSGSTVAAEGFEEVLIDKSVSADGLGGGIGLGVAVEGFDWKRLVSSEVMEPDPVLDAEPGRDFCPDVIDGDGDGDGFSGGSISAGPESAWANQ
jgi:hypothetical protein